MKMSTETSNISNKPYSFADAGWKDTFPKELHLLPLLQPSKDTYNALYAPLHLLPDEWISGAQLAFEMKKENEEDMRLPEWMVTKHIFPAAYPRSHPQSVFVPGKHFEPNQNSNVNKMTSSQLKQKRKEDIKTGVAMIQSVELENFLPAHNEREANEKAQKLAQSGQPQLWGCVERIASVRERPKGKPITLILAHATGFHKEIFRPCLQGLIEEFESQQDQCYIDEIWSLDNFRTGDAAVLNAPFVGPAISCHDIARDIQQFIQYYLPVRNLSGEDGFDHYMLNLKRQECGKAKSTRTIVAIGHSQGAATLLMAINAIAKPDQPKTQLVDGFISFDAAFPLRESVLLQPLPQNEFNVALTLVRKDMFNDQDELMNYLHKVPMFQAFDDRTKKLYAKFGFKQIDVIDRAKKDATMKKKTALVPKMSKWAEALSFSQLWLNCWTSREVQARKYQGWTHFIVSTFIRDYPYMTVAELYHFCKKEAELNAPAITFQHSNKGHLYPMEDPEGFGKLKRWDG